MRVGPNGELPAGKSTSVPVPFHQLGRRPTLEKTDYNIAIYIALAFDVVEGPESRKEL